MAIQEHIMLDATRIERVVRTNIVDSTSDGQIGIGQC
jgi:hypothetical protein